MSTGVVWFRKCLRLDDNPALLELSRDQSIRAILPIYILDPQVIGNFLDNYGKARIRFLIESLQDLDALLKARFQSELLIYQGDPLEIFKGLVRASGSSIDLIVSEYCSEPHGRKLSQAIEMHFQGKSSSPKVRLHKAVHTLSDLEDTVASAGFKNPKSMKDVRKIFSDRFDSDKEGFLKIPSPVPIPRKLQPLPEKPFYQILPDSSSIRFHSLPSFRDEISNRGLLPTPIHPSPFKGGETEALARLKRKVTEAPDFVNSFRKPKTFSTNQPADPLEPSTTGLSPYLSTGCLSVRRLWEETEKHNRTCEHTQPPESLHGQLLFREMFYLLSRSIDHWDNDVGNSMCKQIDWGDEEEKMQAWEKGLTGFPYIDAMMRQLDATGWMHHLGRHAVSCFLTRGQLWQHWKKGRDVFERKLLDSDWALNNANWLWLSGVAPFSMPYFRLYNPCPDSKSSLNVETKSAQFIKFWIPELENFPPKYIYEPHLAPHALQSDSKCIIGRDYPNPIVDRKTSAAQNLKTFKLGLKG